MKWGEYAKSTSPPTRTGRNWKQFIRAKTGWRSICDGGFRKYGWGLSVAWIA
jgi:hypothetical protein